MKLDAKSEIVLRQAHFLKGHLLLVNAPQDQLAQQLQVDQVNIWTWNFADFQYFEQQHIQATFDVVAPQHAFDQVIIFVPKAKEQLNYVLAQVAQHLKLGQQIFLVGEKKAGIEGAAKQLQAYGKPLKLDSARHCQMWHIQLEQQSKKTQLEDWIKTYEYVLPNVNASSQPAKPLTICALPGVFSQNRLDVGTAQLLPFLQQVRSGKILDFGCGAGILSLILATLNAKNQLVAADIDAFALKSTELSFAKNNLSAQLQTQAITDIKDVTQDFNAIVSNPPFHQGIKTHYQASERLCQHAATHLKPHGQLWLVANRFLNYSPFIEERFGQCEIKADQQGFKVFFAQN